MGGLQLGKIGKTLPVIGWLHGERGLAILGEGKFLTLCQWREGAATHQPIKIDQVDRVVETRMDSHRCVGLNPIKTILEI